MLLVIMNLHIALVFCPAALRFSSFQQQMVVRENILPISKHQANAAANMLVNTAVFSI